MSACNGVNLRKICLLIVKTFLQFNPSFCRYVPSPMNCVTMGRFFFILWAHIIQFGRITSDIINGMSATGVGHIAKLLRSKSWGQIANEPPGFVTYQD